jgi:arylsulfatase A-like enzyme
MGLASGGHWEIGKKSPLLPQLLRSAGYETAAFGIWHVSADPLEYGFQYYDADAETERCVANALSWLSGRSSSAPLFCMIGVSAPHREFTDRWPELPAADSVRVPPYLPDHPEVREEMVRFYGDVSRMDAGMGRILDLVHEQGLDEQTLVIYTSDHGIGMPLAKGTLYDRGLKVPLVVRWSGSAEGGRRCGDLVSNVDVLPTVMDAVGLGDATPDGLDGHSLWPFVASGASVAHEHVYAEQTWHDFYEPMRAVRTASYKLIRNYAPGRGLQIAADILPSRAVDVMRKELREYELPPLELYDLREDAVERKNLAGDPSVGDLERRLADELDRYLRDTNDPILDGVVPAPLGYWEHFLAKPAGPGALPPAQPGSAWVTTKWPAGATRHVCEPERSRRRAGE